MKKKITLLVVNDNKYDHKLLEISAKKSKVTFALDHVYNGKEAVDKIKGNKGYDAILMNVEMPVMNGLEATQSIRTLGYTKPILGWSAHFRSFIWPQCQKAGMDDYVNLWSEDMLANIVLALIKCKVIDF